MSVERCTKCDAIRARLPEKCPECGAAVNRVFHYEFSRRDYRHDEPHARFMVYFDCGRLWDYGGAKSGQELEEATVDCLRRQIARLRREREVLAEAVRARHEFEARRDWSVPDEAWPGAAYYGTMAVSDEAWRRALKLLEEGVLEDEQAN